MTAGGVPAIDFGPANRLPENQPASFRSAMDSIPGSGKSHTGTQGSGSPGACTVSSKCYLPNVLVNQWIMPRLAKSKNLLVFLRTAIRQTERDSDGNIVALHAVQRTPRPGKLEWKARLSEEIRDWYNPIDSETFTKKSLVITAKVFIDATELGDVLATSGVNFGQGIEVPHEDSTTYESGCGQAQTLTFYAELLGAVPTDPYVPPLGADGGIGWPDGTHFTANGGADWRHAWTWRRSSDTSTNKSIYSVNIGDITQQNLGNDLDTAYPLLPIAETKAEVLRGWAGGVNVTALRMLEDRAFGWYWYLKNTSKLVDPSWNSRLVLNRTSSGTIHGLSKMVYWRDSRRAIGIDGYRLTHPPLRDVPGATGVKFADRVALGDYNDDTHHLRMPECIYPAYLGTGRGEGAKPYYIPLRALLVGGVGNLLVAGKTLAQSFHANSNTRLHPSEWSTGVAAGGTAVMMVRKRWTSSDALANVKDVQSFLNSSSVGAPLDWTGIINNTDGPHGSACELGRCDPATQFMSVVWCLEYL